MNETTETHNASSVRRCLTMALFLQMMTFGTASHAVWPKTPQDFVHLPRYCAARLLEADVPKAERDRWAKRIGPDFIHIHHYCAAQHSLRLANAADNETARKQLLRAVVNEINYVEQHSTSTFFLRAETGVQKGRALLRLNDIPGAIASFNNALKVNSRFPAAYAGIADAYLMLKQPAKARVALERGIKAAPNSKNLRVRLAAIK